MRGVRVGSLLVAACVAFGVSSMGLRSDAHAIAGTSSGWISTRLPAPAGSAGRPFVAEAVTCPSTASCYAIGDTFDNFSEGAPAVNELGPRGWQSRALKGLNPSDSSLTVALSCSHQGFCAGGGSYGPGDNLSNGYATSTLLTKNGIAVGGAAGPFAVTQARRWCHCGHELCGNWLLRRCRVRLFVLWRKCIHQGHISRAHRDLHEWDVASPAGADSGEGRANKTRLSLRWSVVVGAAVSQSAGKIRGPSGVQDSQTSWPSPTAIGASAAPRRRPAHGNRTISSSTRSAVRPRMVLARSWERMRRATMRTRSFTHSCYPRPVQGGRQPPCPIGGSTGSSLSAWPVLRQISVWPLEWRRQAP